MTKKYQLTGLGNAIVDVISTDSDQFLAEYGITKGAMTLIDEARSNALYAAMGPSREVSGGSAANTMAGFASFGGRGVYLGKVADDQLGEIFAHDTRSIGVHYATPPLKGGPSTARCLIIVTPDAQRSMNTYLGASVEFSESDVDADAIANSQYIYLEGYLFDKAPAKKAYQLATSIARKNGTKVSLTLSDSFCVERHRDDYLKLLHETDVLFANEAELLALYQTANFDDAVARARQECSILAVTRGAKGSLLVTKDQIIEVKAAPVAQLVDTTGAGDQYAAGVLYGLVNDMPLERCGQLGSIAAAEVISHVGPRPEVSLSKLAA